MIGIFIAVASQSTGVNSIMYYGTQVLIEAGFSTKAALIANTLNGLTSVTAVSIGLWLINKINRRPMLLCGFAGTTTALFLIALSSLLMTGNPMLPYIILSLTVMFLTFMQGAIGPILWLSLAEIFPLRLRGFGMGICVFFVWMTNFVIGLAFPVLLSSFGLHAAFFGFCAIGIVSIALTIKYMPETRGHTLEQIEQCFRSHNS